MASTFQASHLPSDWLDRAFNAPGSVLLHAADPAQPGARSLLFTDPVRYIVASSATSLDTALADVEAALASGHHVAGYVTYEAGLVLHGLPHHAHCGDEALLCFGVYAAPEQHIGTPAARDVPEAPSLDLALFPTVERSDYEHQIARLQEWIGAGDIYQANYTFPLRGITGEAPRTIYQALLRQQPAAFAAALNLAPSGHSVPQILSFSPELFVQTDPGGTIHTQPMKGTVARHPDPTEDSAAAAWLAADPKNRAEHVMIVDLLRNDLGRICETGSVATDNVFHVRTLPTVHQMISDVRGRLRKDTQWSSIVRALFPSGSITGAPKIRAMQLLHQVEKEARGVYTGAIGYIAPTRESCFSVAIRTLSLRPCNGRLEVTCNVGGGIVADSSAASEYSEAMLKASFIRRAGKPLCVIETMLSEAGQVRWLETHLDRLQRTAEALIIPFQRAETRQRVLAVMQQLPQAPHRLRLQLEASGELTFRTEPLSAWSETLRVRLARHRSHLGDPALAFKTTIREAYDSEIDAAQQAGFDESIFANDAGLLTEGCLTSLFCVRDGRILTPYIECGVLPGILRTKLLRRNLVEESLLPLADVESCDAVLLGNSLRGFYPVRSLELAPSRVLTWNTAAAEPHLHQLRSVFHPEGGQ